MHKVPGSGPRQNHFAVFFHTLPSAADDSICSKLSSYPNARPGICFSDILFYSILSLQVLPEVSR